MLILNHNLLLFDSLEGNLWISNIIPKENNKSNRKSYNMNSILQGLEKKKEDKKLSIRKFKIYIKNTMTWTLKKVHSGNIVFVTP